MRAFILALLMLPCWASAEKVLLLPTPPEDCTEHTPVQISAGGPVYSFFRTNAAVQNSARKKLMKAARKEDGNRVVIDEKRVFRMDKKRFGIERIEIDARVWQCPPSPNVATSP